MVESLGEGGEIWGVRRSQGGFVSNRQGDYATQVNSGGETKIKKGVRVTEDASGNVRKGGRDSSGVWVRGRGLAWGKESSSDTREGVWPLFNWRGHCTRNMLGGVLFEFLGLVT